MRKEEARDSLLRGFSFGLTSGVITTLGAVVGVFAGSESTLAVVSTVFSIAFADAFSDALGIHVSEESQRDAQEAGIWRSTISTLFSKLIVALSFVVPLLLFPLTTAVIIDIAWGFLLIGAFSLFIARSRHASPAAVAGEHLGLTILVITATYYIGRIIRQIAAG